MRASELRKLRFRHKLRKLSYPEERAQIIQHPYLTDGRERYDRVAAALALEPRDPFLDIRVIEFCLSLPLPQLQSDGWLKIIVRRATAGILPDEVRWRRGKEHLGLLFTQTLFSLWPNWVSQIFPIHSPLSSYVKHDLKREPHSERPGASRLAPSFKLFYLYGWLSFKSRSRGD